MEQYESRGYLLADHRIFFLEGASFERMEYHYHTFHKLLYLLEGSARYTVEGKQYILGAGDLVLVKCGAIHRPEVQPDSPYKRVILYLAADISERVGDTRGELTSCFETSALQGCHVLRLDDRTRARVLSLLEDIRRNDSEDMLGAELLSRSCIVQLLVLLGRCMQRQQETVLAVYDEKIQEILRYINDHLTEDLKIEALSARFYISKYYMMRRFKEVTGTTIHGYITGKRLIRARGLLQSGQNAGETCYLCGFKDYSSFSRAYKKEFGRSPAGGKST